MVKELSIVLGVEPPLVSKLSDVENEDEHGHLLPLNFPSSRKLDVFCLLNQRDHTPPSESLEFLQLLKSVQEDDMERDMALEEVHHDFALRREELDDTAEEDAVDDWIKESLISSVETERNDLCGEVLLGDLHPLEIRIPTEVNIGPLPSWTSPYRDFLPSNLSRSISIYYSPSVPEKGELLLSDIVSIERSIGPELANATRLYGFPPSFLVALRSQLETDPTKRDMISSGSWSWDLEDGTVFSISKASNTSS